VDGEIDRDADAEITDVPLHRNRAAQPRNATAPRKCADLGAQCVWGGGGARTCSLCS
jgi:hypothetical protein